MLEMPINKLTAEEFGIMDRYRRAYAISNDAGSTGIDYAPMNEILREWSDAKNQYLYKLFGEQLILEKEIHYEKGVNEMCKSINMVFDSWTAENLGRNGRDAYEFTKEYYDIIYPPRGSIKQYQLTIDARHGMEQLLNSEPLVNNIFNGETFVIEVEGKKPLKINRGSKVMRALSKIADYFDLAHFEDFRIYHSQVLNQKSLSGTLCLSIHPMDYMTMSDNGCGWDSCMSWIGEGGYRQGTVEMMNSNCTIVAYLKSEDDFSTYTGDKWNNKKWRQLFVVNDDLLIGVKAYPYQNDDLSKAVIDWLRELAEKNLNRKYCSTTVIEYEKSFRISTETGEKDVYLDALDGYSMYNDFGSAEYHHMALVDGFDADKKKYYGKGDDFPYIYSFSYHGLEQCMVCGDTRHSFENESCLACKNCQTLIHCDCCGDPVADYVEIDGQYLCEYCYDNRTRNCAITGELHLTENMIPIFVIPRFTEERIAAERVKYAETWGEPRKAFTDMSYFRYCEGANSYVYGDDAVGEWEKKFLLPGHYLHERETKWMIDWYVYYDELTTEAKDEFCYGITNNEEAYDEHLKCRYGIAPSRIIENT